MNAKHTIWNSRLKTTKGKTLATHAEENDYDIITPKKPYPLPQKPTPQPRHPGHSPKKLQSPYLQN